MLAAFVFSLLLAAVSTGDAILDSITVFKWWKQQDSNGKGKPTGSNEPEGEDNAPAENPTHQELPIDPESANKKDNGSSDYDDSKVNSFRVIGQ